MPGRIHALLACALLLAALVWSFAREGPRDAGLGAERATTPAPSVGRAPTPLAGLGGPPARAAARESSDADAAGAAASESAAPTARLVVRALDVDGVPAPGVKVLAAPPRHPLNLIGFTDARGELALEWCATTWPAQLIVEARASGDASLTGLRRLAVPSGGTATLEVVLASELLPDPLGRIDWSASDEVPLTSLRHEWLEDVSLEAWTKLPDLIEYSSFRIEDTDRFREAIRRSGPPPRSLFEPEVQRDAEGRARFVSGAAHGRGLYTLEDIEFSDHDESDVAPELAKAHGVVRDQVGAPAPGVRVSAERPRGGVLAVGRTDEEGRFELEFLAGDVLLRAGGLARGSTRTAALAGGISFEWNPAVKRAEVLAGTLPVDVQVARVEASVLRRQVGGDALHVSVTRAVGGAPFAVACPPGPTFDVHVTPLSPNEPAVARRFEGLGVGADWAPTFDAPATLRLTPRDRLRDGVQFPGASEVRVFEPGGARGARVPAWGRRGEELAFTVASGAWSVEVGTGGPFWSAPLAIDAPPLADVALGEVAFGSEGRVRLPAHPRPADSITVELTREDVGFDSVVLPESRALLDADVRLALPTGRYAWRHTDGVREPFEVRAGGEVRLTWRAPKVAGEVDVERGVDGDAK